MFCSVWFFFFVSFFYLFVFHGFTLLFPFLNTVLGLFLFNKTRSAHAKKLRVSQGPRLLPSTELLFNTFWVKIIPSEPNTDWQPNIKQSHFVNSFTEVQMSNPTPLCIDTTAVVLGCLLFFFLQDFLDGGSCYCLREKTGFLWIPGTMGLLTNISSPFCLFIVQNAAFVSKTEAFNIFKACLPLSCGAHTDGAKQGHPEFTSSYNWT